MKPWMSTLLVGSWGSARWEALATLLLVCTLQGVRAQSSAKYTGYRFIDCGNEGEEMFPGTYFVPDGSLGLRYTLNGTAPSYVFKIDSTTLTEPEKTLRRFDSAGGCYTVPVRVDENDRSSWVYLVRLGFAYQNYDGKRVYPSFMVTLNGVDVEEVELERWETASGNPETAPMGGNISQAHYTEYLGSFPSGAIQVCLSTANGIITPLINTLEIMPVPPSDGLITYMQTGSNSGLWGQSGLLLALRHRMNLGGPTVTDALNRTWHPASDTSDWYNMMRPNGIGLGHADNSTNATVDVGSMVQLPQGMLQTAWQGNGTDGLDLSLSLDFFALDATLHPMLARLFFAELDPTVKPGERVARAVLSHDSDLLQTLDWAFVDPAANASVNAQGSNGTLKASFQPLLGCIPDSTGGDNYTTLWVTLMASPKRKPLLNGLELWEVIPRSDNDTLCPLQFAAHPPAPWTDSLPRPWNQHAPASPSGGLSAGAIIGIVLASVTGLMLLGALVVLLRGRLHSTKQSTSFQRFESDVLHDVSH